VFYCTVRVAAVDLLRGGAPAAGERSGGIALRARADRSVRSRGPGTALDRPRPPGACACACYGVRRHRDLGQHGPHGVGRHRATHGVPLRPRRPGAGLAVRRGENRPGGMATGRSGVTHMGTGRRPAGRAGRVPVGTRSARAGHPPSTDRSGHAGGHPARAGEPGTGTTNRWDAPRPSARRTGGSGAARRGNGGLATVLGPNGFLTTWLRSRGAGRQRVDPSGSAARCDQRDTAGGCANVSFRCVPVLRPRILSVLAPVQPVRETEGTADVGAGTARRRGAVDDGVGPGDNRNDECEADDRDEGGRRPGYRHVHCQRATETTAGDRRVRHEGQEDPAVPRP
jgi:hypothetical protein